MDSPRKDDHGSVNMPPRKEKAKRSGNDPAQSPVSEQQARSGGNQHATGVVKIRRATRWGSNPRARPGLPAKRFPNPQPEIVRRMEHQLAHHGPPLPRRGDVTRGIIKGAVDSACGFCFCSPASIPEVDRFLDELPFPTKSQAVARLWPDVGA